MEPPSEKIDQSIAPDPSALSAATSSATFAKRKHRGGNIRKRDETDIQASEEDKSAVVRVTKQQRGDAMVFTTMKAQAEDLSGVQYDSSKMIQQGKDALATGYLETETQIDRDARALREKVLQQGDTEVVDDGTYKGLSGYVDYRKGFRREHNVGAEKGTGSHGPLRANMYARVSTRFDYQPDICKDYKETGFCSYGDSCKFLHDRGDYKSGWELERDWDAEQKKKIADKLSGWNPDNDDDEAPPNEDEDQDDGLPFACLTCRRTWEECKSPVVTRCKHYFCESCALKTNAKTGKCEACGQPTQGIFNVAQDILKKMKRSKE